MDIKTIQLSKNAPQQGSNPWGGYTIGTKATFFQTEDGKYGYCYHGIGYGGNSFESEDAEGFDSLAEAEADAQANYVEITE